jgi:hypothetical protein
MWELVTDPQNRELLGWLSGGLAAVAVGAWPVFTIFRPPTGAGSQPSSWARPAAAAGRDVNARDIITFSTPDKPSKRKR